MSSLDQFIVKQNMHWINRSIEDYLGIGATIDDVMALIGKWLTERKRSTHSASPGVIELGASWLS
ncbi:hypothetical protein [Bradyrhizobium sp. Gha]|uniref:hypothetical protein n=1 Tax=Bradyrhizobium sp. Gha TaxID=1855318 RepID=UPI000B8311EA|nr:hypothetical protein [Bradyrhizobium sp. Gha]